MKVSTDTETTALGWETAELLWSSNVQSQQNCATFWYSLLHK